MDTDKLPQNYDDLKEALDKLFPKWEKELKEKFGKEFKLSKDGALLWYFKQKYKILSIGRESHSDTPDLSGLVEYFLSHHDMKELNRKFRGKDARPNDLVCWQLMARVVYGLLHDIDDWNKIPEKEDLEGPFIKGEFSFAVMNVSKYEHAKNEDGEYTSGLSKIFKKCAYESLGGKKKPFSRNFTREEIDLLDPDLIIAWNLSLNPGVRFLEQLTDPSRAGRCYPEMWKLPSNKELKQTSFPPDKLVNVWMYNSPNGREIPLINAYHFSDYQKNNNESNRARYYYNPIRDAVKKLIAEGKLNVRKG